MSFKVIKTFEIKRLEILNQAGKCDDKLKPKLSNEDIKKLYEAMILTRIYDQKAFSLQRSGRLGTYPEMQGQEATIIGSASALENDDWIFPSFREVGGLILRGYSAEQSLQYWGGDERGLKIDEELNIFPMAITVGAQSLHAVGAGMAKQIKKEEGVIVTYFGDGATSEGDLSEALNFAGVFNVPIVFICQNNQFAISVSRKKQTKAETLAQKAIAAGFEGIQVDGNDVFAVYKATKDALTKARNGKGPTFIECETYRMGDHTTSDDASRYRDKKEVESWKKKDPIERLEKYMKAKKIWNETYHNKVVEDATKKVENAVNKYLNIQNANPEEIFGYIYSDLTYQLKEQMKEFREQGGK